MLFKKAVSTSAYLKAGLMGFAGSGKTRTATELAIGLVKLMRERQLKEGSRPVFFLDTETGSDFVEPRLRESGIELSTAKTRAFVDLMTAVKEAEKDGSVLIIDSITHFWREFCEAYQKKKNRTRLEFQDWAALKADWGKFTDAYINSACHIVLCGRAGFEYDFFENADGKKELQKTGVKMKAEGEMGYEPSLLILMERETNMETKRVYRVAHVLKERFGVIDGKALCDEKTGGPTFEMFLPHVRLLNLGGQQLGVDTERTSAEMFADDGSTRWQHERKQKEIALAEVREEIVKMYPGQAAADKKAKGDLLEMAFGTRAWEKVESMHLSQVKEGRNRIWHASRGHGYGYEPGVEDTTQPYDHEEDPPPPAEGEVAAQ
jgi:hypothetical protein